MIEKSIKVVLVNIMNKYSGLPRLQPGREGEKHISLKEGKMNHLILLLMLENNIPGSFRSAM